MEVGEKDKSEVQAQVPWVPTTPLKPILPNPVPIYNPGEGNQLGSNANGTLACFETSITAEILTGSHLWSAPMATAPNIGHESAKTRVPIHFDNISSSSSGIVEFLAQAGASSVYANASLDGILSQQFVPIMNTQFNPTCTVIGYPHLSSQQPLINTIQGNYQDPQGTSYSTYYPKTTSQIAPLTPNNAITAEARQGRVIQMNVQRKDQGREDGNLGATKFNNPHNKPDQSVTEFGALSTPSENFDKGMRHDIDLNKTPRSKPRRRKHRPKVIKEGKPKTAGKPVTPKPVQSKENPTEKRKYTRRKGSNMASTPETGGTGEWTEPLTHESAKKTCRRSLNFDLGEPPKHGSSSGKENAIEHFVEGCTVVEERQALNTRVSLQQDTQAPSTYLSNSNCYGAKPNAKHIENCSTRSGMVGQDGHKNSAKIQSLSVSQSSVNDSKSSDSEILTRLQAVGSKRNHSGTVEHADNSCLNLFGARYNTMQAYFTNYQVHFPNVQKKKRSEKGKVSNKSSKSSMTSTKDVQLETCPQAAARSHPCASISNCWNSGSEYNTVRVPVMITAKEGEIQDKPQSLAYNLSFGQRMPTKKRSRITTRIHDCTSLALAGNCYTKLSHTTKQLGGCDRQTLGDAESPQTCVDALNADNERSSLPRKKRSKKRSTLVSSAYYQSLQLLNSSDVAYKKKWKNIQTVDALTEEFRHLNIYSASRELVLHQQNALVPYAPQNWKYKDGTIIPFEGPFDPIRKQRPRPKVDLDEETNRVWRLLMLDINSHGIDGTDEETAKRWEEERNVFRGRADSFIARMHLVQGDRRFSQWKGSVVDSVIGVFLTQNVSDHLSSSAFMSLAARFPLKSSSKHKKYHEESTSFIVKEPQVHILEPEENEPLDGKILNPSVHELSSMTINIIELSEEREAVDSNDSRTIGSLISLTDESISKQLESAQRHIREHSPVESGPISAMTAEGQESSCQEGVSKELNDVLSSQCSVITSQIPGEFSNDQNSEKIGSFSDSNSEAEDLSSTAKYNIFYNRTSFSKLLEMASSTKLSEVNSQSVSTENIRDAYGESIRMKHNNLEENLEKSDVTQGSLEAPINLCDDYTLKMTPDSGVLEVNFYDPLKIEALSSGSSKNKDENDKSSAFPTTESESQAAFAHSQGQTQDPMQKAQELDFGEHSYAMRNENSKIDPAPIKLRGRERGKEKKSNFDWDSLRIQAQAKAGKREKTENTMDSLDWDAVRRADVHEIADAIKERGMNNMLAERIKNFLNLLVDVHGSIDLEWLRDVPPDQAKEFLLSIKGLGLKSVECVRLLTLHHLAFPVDTNVGRIAVRLGWVPLQPLPESLQLHLLELYPVLESIQKYLWPRLCKLDQRTLYELHYQLITFGKVFCTKSKPNCNACPMRGECRHFASAFASARLALPGPEQKSIIIATGNNATDKNPSVVINPLSLPPPENTNQPELLQTEVTGQNEAKSETNICHPIIEEPASPEPESSQVSENDIEDFPYGESHEIPRIEVNMEEFTLNLQNYVQANMVLQESEMSKALIALHPEAACIPTPKLKNVSRLRTEHCVYELPDTHCLLEGWDKREPDDPGRYLLAIWTPGETAYSIQPPSRKCSSQDCGQLCNEKECFSCNTFREANSQIVRGTILIPCRTAMRGSFPLNGTYFQVNEVFADHESSVDPISVPRSWIWNLNRRTVYFGTSIPTIFKGLSTQEIQQCFWRGFVCVRGFDRETRAPRPLTARLHFPASKLAKNKEKTQNESPQVNSQGLNFQPDLEQPELLSSSQNLRQTRGA